MCKTKTCSAYILYALFLSGTLLSPFLGQRNVYPFSCFPMFSHRIDEKYRYFEVVALSELGARPKEFQLPDESLLPYGRFGFFLALKKINPNKSNGEQVLKDILLVVSKNSKEKIVGIRLYLNTVVSAPGVEKIEVSRKDLLAEVVL